jgi:hypothetical protein
VKIVFSIDCLSWFFVCKEYRQLTELDDRSGFKGGVESINCRAVIEGHPGIATQTGIKGNGAIRELNEPEFPVLILHQNH